MRKPADLFVFFTEPPLHAPTEVKKEKEKTTRTTKTTTMTMMNCRVTRVVFGTDAGSLGRLLPRWPTLPVRGLEASSSSTNLLPRRLQEKLLPGWTSLPSPSSVTQSSLRSSVRAPAPREPRTYPLSSARIHTRTHTHAQKTKKNSLRKKKKPLRACATSLSSRRAEQKLETARRS